MPAILLVDDDTALLDALPRAIETRMPDVTIDTCDSAAMAVQRVKGVDYDAIITDIKMPGMDGLSLLSVIQQIRPRTPTLLITGHGEHDLAVQALRGGAYDFIQKPIDRDYFIASLKRALQATELQRQVEAQKETLERRAEDLDRVVQERTRDLLRANHLKDQLLTERERALADARDSHRRLSFLVEASNVLASLDYEHTLESIAQLTVPTLAEHCVVHVASRLRSPRYVAVFANRSEDEEALRDCTAAAGDRDLAFEVHQALGGGVRALRVDPAQLSEGAMGLGPEHVEYLSALGGRDVIVVPLEVHGRLLGTISLGLAPSERRYDEEDVILAEALARRCALSVDNARLYMESEDTSEHLREANEAKDEFLALISHEMRTPLTTVCGSAQMLVSRGERMAPESRRELIESLAREAQRLRRIVEDLLVLARVEMGGDLAVVPVSLHTSIRSAGEALKRMHPERQVEVRAPDDLPLLAAEPTYVEQLFHNLVSNADKYSPLRYPIEIEAGMDEHGMMRVSVLDRGVGVEAHEVDLIFERFYRSERTNAPGVGMGLTVCRRLIEALSGRIWANLREGGGLEVSFTLPIWEPSRAEPPQPFPEERAESIEIVSSSQPA